MSDDTLEGLIGELEALATALRAGELDPDAAADAVERCAGLAGQIGAHLDAAGRASEGGSTGQETLL